MSAYKPPSVKNEILRKEMSVLLDLAILNRPNVICIGDLNCDLLHPVDNGKQGRELLDICDVYDLHNLINETIRVSSTKESCLDVILTNVPSLVLKCYYDQNLMSSLSQKRFLFSLSEVAVPVSVIEMNFGAL